MIRNRNFAVLLSSALLVGACATATDEDKGGQDVPDRDQAVQQLQQQAGAPVSVEVGETGATRVLAMTPRFHVRGSDNNPAAVATNFVAQNHDAFNLTAEQATSFTVTRIDTETKTGLSHVTLQRTYDGVPIWQGAITVHLDQVNGVYTALGDPNYNISRPTNQQLLTPSQAVAAAANLLGLGDLGASIVSSAADRTVFSSTKLIDDAHVTPSVFPVAAGDNRFAYQVTLAWNDATSKELQYRLVHIDAERGVLLNDVSLVNDFTGRVYTASPGANPQGDPRTVVSFNGDPASSPQGWVGTARKTIGNNAVAATDLNANNAVGANETQPTADANDSFDFPYSAQTDAAQFKAAAVTNAFFLVNDYHDRTYALGFTEASGNFQTSNFGKGGAQADEVQVDAQDGSGTNNANFATPPDGQKPRMQMFLFNIINANVRQDGDFDASVIYHENTHGVSNRLVGGGSTNCLNNLQSGGMGEGWGDFMGASFLNNPIVGAYVTGDATVGIRQFSMANSPFTYASIKNGTISEVHDVGELWAATLWDVRTQVGKATAEQLTISGMKLTPCNPSMINARDAIIQADANLNAGANRCKLFTAFAGRAMGQGAASPNDRSTTAITTSTALPADCGGTQPPVGVTRTFTSTDINKSIPDNNATGVRSNDSVTATGTASKITVSTNITHTFRGDLVIQVVSPSGQVATLSNRAGGSADNFVATNLDITSSFTGSVTGTWQLFVRDLAAVDVGKINSFSLTITTPN